MKSLANAVHAAEASELRHEPAVRSQGAADALKRRVLIVNPMQNGVAEHSVELPDKRQILDAAHHRFEAAAASAPHLGLARVDRDTGATGLDERLRQRAVATADVEHALAGDRL